MFWGANATALPGCVLLVDQITSRVNPQQKYFAGVLLGVREKGIMSNMVLRSMVMDVGVEMTIPIFSPMISNITVLKDAPEDIKEKEAKNVYWAREKYAKSSLNFEEIEGMVLKHKNQLFRAKQVLAEKSAKVKGSSASPKN
jgi:ribosomal protein L19